MANIRTARRSGLVLRGGRNVRETVWGGTTETRNGLAAANTAALSNSLNAAALALRPFTVIRTRLHWSLESDQTAASEDFQAAIGMAVVSDQASAVGITAVPTPFTDLASDLWLLYDMMFGSLIVTSAIGSFESRYTKDIDSKAMRKVEDGQDLILVKENSSLSDGTVVTTAGRFLLKLH